MKSILVVSSILLSSPSVFALCSEAAKVRTVINELSKEDVHDCKDIKSSTGRELHCKNDVVLEFGVDETSVLAEGYIGSCPGGSVYFHMQLADFGSELENGLCEVKTIEASGFCED